MRPGNRLVTPVGGALTAVGGGLGRWRRLGFGFLLAAQFLFPLGVLLRLPGELLVALLEVVIGFSGQANALEWVAWEDSG